MPIALSVRRSATRDLSVLPVSLLFVVLLGGCVSPATIVVDDLLDPISTAQPWLPDRADLAAAALARAAWVGGAQTDASVRTSGSTSFRTSDTIEVALETLRGIEVSEEQEDLLPLAIDLRNATLDDPAAYRASSRELRKKWGLDPRLKARLDRTIGDDPLRLAGRRQFDGWHRLWARTFNAVAEPIGSSAISGFVLAPYQLANSLLHYVAEFSNSEPLSMTDRQALALREEFVARHPNAADTAKLKRKIDRDRVRLEKTLARRRIRAAEGALDTGNPTLALRHTTAAAGLLAQHPESNGRTRKKAARLAERAGAARDARARRAARSLEAVATPRDRLETELRLAVQLLAEPARPDALATPLANYRAVAGQAAETRIDFVRGLALHESGFEAAARKQLKRAAATSPGRDSMARHADILLDDDWQNPYGAFERLRRKAVRNELAWRLAGEWVRRPRYPNLPAPLAYLIDAPTIAITIVLAPLRALISPWTGAPDFQRTAAQAGYRYLVRYPEGEELRPVVDWLYAYESKGERWDRALRMADWMPEFDSDERLALVEKAAAARLERLEKVDRRDERSAALRGIAQEFPDSDGGQLAGLQARADRKEASAQHIRITKDFLLENPSVAGPEGIGLNSRLLNDDVRDGELHPEGVVLRGGRILEILLIAEGGDKKDSPESRVRKVSKGRLTQIAASLDEAVQRNSLIDVDARHKADANRDLYLERAGLGLTEEMDARPEVESTFVYLSLRERYGIVRGRDSVLPFDLVFRGNLGDFTMGAFPRWRTPRETPDAFLYR